MCSGGAKNPSSTIYAFYFFCRYGFNTPPNYNDHELYCGGYSRQWRTNGGKCGICGDPWDTKQVCNFTILNAVVFCQPSSVLRSGKRARSGLRGLFLGPVLF